MKLNDDDKLVYELYCKRKEKEEKLEIKLKNDIEKAISVFILNNEIPREHVVKIVANYIIGLLDLGKEDLMKGVRKYG